MSRTAKYLNELGVVFRQTQDKREANYKCTELLREMSGDKVFFSEILCRHIESSDNFNSLHYPVVGIQIANNEYFTLVANCWIPLPDRSSNISTKAIHHHGDMLLSTVTAFGPGYEHWMFETPAAVDRDREIYELKLLERAAHPLNHVAFVDSYIAHLPLYPPDTTITYALWSSQFATTWKDRVKRVSALQRNSQRLRSLARKIGLAKQLELKVVEYFDFYPTCDGFRGIKDREEFPRTTNDDYLASLFHVIQVTGNENLVPTIRRTLSDAKKIDNRALVEKYVGDLESGRSIEGRLSAEHYNVPKANFSKDEILTALGTQNGGPRH
jgi:hypothetical protein